MQQNVIYLSEARLVSRAQLGESEANEALYQKHHARIFRLAYALLGDATDAEDVAHESLTRALLKIEQFDDSRGSFSVWLHAIATYRCRDFKRRRRSRWLSLSTWLRQGNDVADTRANPERQTSENQDQTRVWSALQTLPPLQREAIVLRLWGGHSYDDISRITEAPLRTVQSRVRLAFGRLKHALGPHLLHAVKEQLK